MLGEELTRVGAVAARATTREIASGSKDEGVVPVAMHLEEARAPASHMLAYPLFTTARNHRAAHETARADIPDWCITHAARPIAKHVEGVRALATS